MEMTLRQKLGQKLIFAFYGTELSPEFKKILKTYSIGNVIIFARNVASAQQLRALCQEIRQEILANTGVIPLIVIDQEGGMVTRLPEDAVTVPCAMALGATGNPDNGRIASEITIRQLRSLGANFNMAPVLDINTNPSNPVIGIRSFGDSPRLVSEFGLASVKAYENSGVLCCGKHFPGHGDTNVDSHRGLPRVDKTLDQLEQAELIPFQEAIAQGIPAIMTSHILFPELEPENVPCTMSRKIITGLLKERLGFQGLIVSDCMEMDAIKDHYGTAKGSVAAVRAGVDLVEISLSPNLMVDAAQALYEAALAGELDMDEIDASVEKILAFKKKIEGFPLVPEQCNLPGDRAACRELSRQALTCYDGQCPVLGEDAFICGCPDYRVSDVANEREDARPFPYVMGQLLGCAYQVTGLDPDPAEIAAVVARAKTHRQVVLGTCNAHLFPGQLALARALAENCPQVTIVSLRDPYDIPLLPKVCCRICAFDYTTDAFHAIAGAFRGEPITGTMPVTL